MSKTNFYQYQTDVLNKVVADGDVACYLPTATGKGEIIARKHVHYLRTYHENEERNLVQIICGHRILLVMDLMKRIVRHHAVTYGDVPFTRFWNYSGKIAEYITGSDDMSMDDIDHKIAIQEYPDKRTGSIKALKDHMITAIQLRQPITIGTTYHSVHRIVTVLKELSQWYPLDVHVDLDEVHRGVGPKDHYAALKSLKPFSTTTVAWTATPGKHRDMITTLVGASVYEMSNAHAIRDGLVPKPKWAVISVTGGRKPNICKGVCQAYREIDTILKTTGKHDSSEHTKILFHLKDSQEVATASMLHEGSDLSNLVNEYPGMMVAHITAANDEQLYHSRIDNDYKILDREKWIDTIKEHEGPLVVFHIDICNAGIDIPGFSAGVWSYFPTSGAYTQQGNGRSARLNKKDRKKLEKRQITSTDRTKWVKPFNYCGILIFSDDLLEDKVGFIRFIKASRSFGFTMDDILHPTVPESNVPLNPFNNQTDRRKPTQQTTTWVEILAEFERDTELENFKRDLPGILAKMGIVR